MHKKILITGGSGLLAINWALSIRDKYAVTLALHQRKISLQGINAEVIALNSVDECLSALDNYQPNIVIHTAGLTDVEQCEKYPNLAKKINADLAQNIAIACNDKSVKLVHISTDHLFSGENELSTEATPVNPLNQYAQSKLQGELAVQEHCKDALIVRTNFFGWGTQYRHSFSDFIINNLKNNKSIELFQDVFFTPILIEELADKVHQLLGINATGVFNVVGNERLSKHEFGIRLAEYFELNTSLITAASIDANPGLINRPKDMSLSNMKLCKTLGYRPANLIEQFKTLKVKNNSIIFK